MSWSTPKGINFRATAEFVTDGTNQGHSLGDAYPVTQTIGGESVTFGWAASETSEARDRTTSNDVRLAGFVFHTNDGSQVTFKVDLPAAGTYKVRLALGDPAYPSGYQYCQVKDGSTVLFTVNDANGTAANHFDDSAGTDFTAAAWPAGNVQTTVTMAGTQMTFVIGSPTAQANSTTLCHVEIEQGASGPQDTPELYGRIPGGLSASRGMNQLLSQ